MRPPTTRVVVQRSGDARHRHAAGRDLLRRVLADELGCRPTEVRLRDGHRGAPELEDPSGPRCSISHTADVVMVAVSATGPVGVDVERADRTPLPPLTAWVAEDERVALTGSPLACAPALVRRWTCKEAVAKALGVGLALPLAAVVVDGDVARVADTTQVWHLESRGIPPGFIATLATLDPVTPVRRLTDDDRPSAGRHAT